MSGHAQKSPSKAERLHRCPGALALVDLLPKEQRGGSSAAADLGTAAHELLERCILARAHPSATPRGTVIPVNGAEFVVNDEMLRGVTIAYEYVEERLTDLGCGWDSVHAERRVNPLPGRDDAHGTADVTIDAWPVTLEVVDYKNGRGFVSHRGNRQLLAYLSGAAHASSYDYANYRITVVQPNAPNEDGYCRSFDVTEAELREFEASHRAACEAADAAIDDMHAATQPINVWAGKWLTAGEHCLYCEAAAICPARSALTQQQAGVDFANAPTEAEILNNEDAVNLLKWADQIKAHIRAAEQYLLNALVAGEPVSGVRLGRRRTFRAWRDDLTEAAIAESMVKAGFIGHNESAKLFKPAELITGPQAEKLVKKELRAKFSDAYLVKPLGEFKVEIGDEEKS